MKLNIPTMLTSTLRAQKLFIPGDAHEACVWVPQKQRLVFSTTKKLPEDQPPNVGLEYIDFSSIDGEWTPESVEGLRPTSWVENSNMANSMCLHKNGQYLLIAEQGSKSEPARVSMRNLDDATDVKTLADKFEGTPLNSVNKVIQSSIKQHVIFTDPDYGYMQGFRPEPKLDPSIYVLPHGNEFEALQCYKFPNEIEIPHGLALSPDEKTLFVTDTSMSHKDDSDDPQVQKNNKTVYAVNFDPESGKISGPVRRCFSPAEGMPDGTYMTKTNLLVGCGDGVYCADTSGKLVGKIPLDTTAVNLHAFGENEENLFVTIDKGVLIYLNWREFVEEMSGEEEK